MNNFKVFLENEEKQAVIDTSTITSDDQYKLGNAAEAGDGCLFSWHVTDDPESLIKMISSAKKITKTYRKGQGIYSELGPGLYLSAAPQLWACRSRNKYDFLKTITPEDRTKLYKAISDDLLEKRSSRYISSGEFEAAWRDLRNWYDQPDNSEAYNFIIHLAGQPINVPFWKPDFLNRLGIQGAKPPKMVKFKIRGKFVDLSNSYGHITRWGPYLRQRYDGAFIKYDPQMVVWRKEAIIDYKVENSPVC